MKLILRILNLMKMIEIVAMPEDCFWLTVNRNGIGKNLPNTGCIGGITKLLM